MKSSVLLLLQLPRPSKSKSKSMKKLRLLAKLKVETGNKVPLQVSCAIPTPAINLFIRSVQNRKVGARHIFKSLHFSTCGLIPFKLFPLCKSLETQTTHVKNKSVGCARRKM